MTKLDLVHTHAINWGAFSFKGATSARRVAFTGCCILEYIDCNICTRRSCRESIELLWNVMDILPNAMTFTCILKACTTVRVADNGKQIHDEIARQGLQQNDIVLGNVVVDMYVKCGTISKVQQVHNGLPSWDVVSWTAVIVGYVQVGHAKQAFDWFEKMQLEGILLNAMTCASVLNVCNALHQYHFRHQTTTFGAHPCTFQNNFEICSQFIDNNELDGCFVAPELWCSSPSTNNGQTAAPTNSKQKHYSN